MKFEGLPVRKVEAGKNVEVSRLGPGRAVIVLSGEADLIKETGSQRIAMGVLSSGDIVGTVEEEKPARSHTILIARKELTIAPLTWGMLEEKISAFEPFEFEVKGLLRRGKVEISPSSYLFPDPLVRTARFFWCLSDLNPEKKSKGNVVVELDIESLSRYLFMTEGETALAVGYLESEGVIFVRDKMFRVTSETKLERLCAWQRE